MKQKKGNNRLPYIIIIILLVLGVALFLYPALSKYVAELNQSEVVKTYNDSVKRMKEEEYEAEWQRAVAYNESLAGEPVKDPFLEGSGMALPEDYLSILNIDGVMGNIEIPKISVNLPIYHGTDTDTLEKGVGHIRQTALPVGGSGTHAVLTGHTGLPNAKLFDDLTEMKEGDLFLLRILNQTLAYEVDSILVVEPEDVKPLDPIPGEDHVTLVTCTPYGINSHRLLVRGVRTEYHKEEVEKQKKEKKGMSAKELLMLEIAVILLLVFLIFIIFMIKRVRRKRKDRK